MRLPSGVVGMRTPAAQHSRTAYEKYTNKFGKQINVTGRKEVVEEIIERREAWRHTERPGKRLNKVRYPATYCRRHAVHQQ